MTHKFVVDRFENGSAVLKTESGETIVWPKTKLPENICEGSVLRVAVVLDDNAESADKELAKNILNEILNP